MQEFGYGIDRLFFLLNTSEEVTLNARLFLFGKISRHLAFAESPGHAPADSSGIFPVIYVVEGIIRSGGAHAHLAGPGTAGFSPALLVLPAVHSFSLHAYLFLSQQVTANGG